MKTSKKTLDPLFDLLVGEMKDRLVEGDEQLVKLKTEFGEEITRQRVKASAATLKTIAGFLKDQGVSVVGENNEALREVQNLLRNAQQSFQDDDDGDPLLN